MSYAEGEVVGLWARVDEEGDREVTGQRAAQPLRVHHQVVVQKPGQQPCCQIEENSDILLKSGGKNLIFCGERQKVDSGTAIVFSREIIFFIYKFGTVNRIGYTNFNLSYIINLKKKALQKLAVFKQTLSFRGLRRKDSECPYKNCKLRPLIKNQTKTT